MTSTRIENWRELVHPSVVEYYDKVSALDAFDKAKVFLDYRITQIFLDNGTKLPDTVMDMARFVSENNLRVTDFGENWQEKRWAQRYDHGYSGIYDWYLKFKDRIFKNDTI
jgi:hypothetical protein